MVRIDNFHPFDSTIRLYLASTDELAPRLVATAGKGRPRVTVQRFDTTVAAQAAALEGAAAADGLAPHALPHGRRFWRIALDVNDRGDFATASLGFGGSPSWALVQARIESNRPRRATICSAQPSY